MAPAVAATPRESNRRGKSGQGSDRAGDRGDDHGQHARQCLRQAEERAETRSPPIWQPPALPDTR